MSFLYVPVYYFQTWKKTGKTGSSLQANLVIWEGGIKKYIRETLSHWREIYPAGGKFCTACREIKIFFFHACVFFSLTLFLLQCWCTSIGYMKAWNPFLYIIKIFMIMHRTCFTDRCNFCHFDIWSLCVKMEMKINVGIFTCFFIEPTSSTLTNLILFVFQTTATPNGQNLVYQLST